MDCSTSGLPILHHLPEFTQTPIRWVNDALQPSCPTLPCSPTALNLFQHQGIFQWVNSSYQVAKVSHYLYINEKKPKTPTFYLLMIIAGKLENWGHSKGKNTQQPRWASLGQLCLHVGVWHSSPFVMQTQTYLFCIITIRLWLQFCLLIFHLTDPDYFPMLLSSLWKHDF